MARFLITYVRNSDPSAGLPYSIQAFKVSHECTAYDVTVPLNTVFFMFATANVETPKELIESFITLKLGNALITSSHFDINSEDNGKRYWVGKVIPLGDINAIYNEHTNVVIPFTCLVGNDEVIDL